MKGAETAENGGGVLRGEREPHCRQKPREKAKHCRSKGWEKLPDPPQSPRVAGSTSEGKMKVATRRFSALLALSKVLTEGPHGLGGKGERKG